LKRLIKYFLSVLRERVADINFTFQQSLLSIYPPDYSYLCQTMIPYCEIVLFDFRETATPGSFQMNGGIYCRMNCWCMIPRTTHHTTQHILKVGPITEYNKDRFVIYCVMTQEKSAKTACLCRASLGRLAAP